MKKPQLCKKLSLLMVIAWAITGCANPALETTPGEAAASETPVLIETPIQAAASATAEPEKPFVVSAQLYQSGSGSFQLQLPDGWNCSESGAFQVNCESPANNAAVQGRITSTGYELTDESLNAFVHAELVARYAERKEYTETKRIETAGRITTTASWRNGDVYWESTDTFFREGRGLFHLTTESVLDQSETFADLFVQVADSVQIFPELLRADAVYPFRKDYTARETFFELSIPTSWGRFIDANAIEKTVVEGFLSPDKRASVQIAIYQQGAIIDLQAKGDNTREIMFALYGYDLVNYDDRQLPDGRERLTWYAERKNIFGITDFDAYKNSLYVLSIVWEPSTEEIYRPVLDEILASFMRE